MDLKGKVALVTGATSGIGYAIAHVLARHNCNVVITGLGALSEVAQVVNSLSSLGEGKAIHYTSDLTQVEDIEPLVNFTQTTFGEIDILVNNAAVHHMAPIESFDIDKWNEIVSVNLSASFHLIRLTLPTMRHKGWGRILNVADAHSLIASPYQAAYVATKHGLAGLTKVVALETAQDSITCNTICPGLVMTSLLSQEIEDKSPSTSNEDLMLNQEPSHHLIKPQALEELVMFLLSESASQVTGSSLSVDGGWISK